MNKHTTQPVYIMTFIYFLMMQMIYCQNSCWVFHGLLRYGEVRMHVYVYVQYNGNDIK